MLMRRIMLCIMLASRINHFRLPAQEVNVYYVLDIDINVLVNVLIFLSQGIFMVSLTLMLLYYGYKEAWFLFAPGSLELLGLVFLTWLKIHLDVVIPRRKAKDIARSTSVDGVAGVHVEEGPVII